VVKKSTQKQTPAKGPAKKSSAQKRPTRTEIDPTKEVEMVQPLGQEAFAMVMDIIANASFLGKDIEKVARLRLELAVVAGVAKFVPDSDVG